MVYRVVYFIDVKGAPHIRYPDRCTVGESPAENRPGTLLQAECLSTNLHDPLPAELYQGTGRGGDNVQYNAAG
jgi:hypothetical protein